MIARRSTYLILPVGILVLAACADSTTGARRPGAMTLSFTNRSAAASAGLAASTDVTVASGSNTLVITRAQLVLGEIELELATADCADGSRGGSGSSGSGSSGSGSSGSGSDCPEVELDPVLVEIPVTSALTTLDLGVLVPPGSYRELEFKIEKADDDTGPEAVFLRAHPDFRGTSVRVEGTFNGQPFTFRSSLEAELELEFRTPLVVSAESALNLTVSVDVASWFRGAGGTVLDPSSTANALAISQNIRSSFAAFEDDDRNGVEDHRR
jgi:hypothetical protein